MGAGRPKLEIPRNKIINIRVTEFEFEKISKIAQKKNISKTEAILQGIDLLINYKPKLTRSQINQMKGIQPKIKENSPGIVESDS